MVGSISLLDAPLTQVSLFNSDAYLLVAIAVPPRIGCEAPQPIAARRYGLPSATITAERAIGKPSGPSTPNAARSLQRLPYYADRSYPVAEF